tara:strand:- start:90 stop:245 length:156 start_codon:yes stop_codon:yes gene_type:complete
MEIGATHFGEGQKGAEELEREGHKRASGHTGRSVSSALAWRMVGWLLGPPP